LTTPGDVGIKTKADFLGRSAEAIRTYRQHQSQISLVVTDMDLPKMSGQEVIKSLYGVNPRVKIIIASGYLDPEIKAKGLVDGARDFLQKPYIPNDLFMKVRRLIDEK
jgi:two-component system cell cycle sensor histidine kinase/response regulator CckA